MRTVTNEGGDNRGGVKWGEAAIHVFWESGEAVDGHAFAIMGPRSRWRIVS